jgi:hypothetical protein
MYYVVVVVGISLSVLSSVVVTKAAVLETKFKRQEAERADAEAERKRKEADAEAERKRKEADAEAEGKRKEEAERKRREEVEAERKRKEAEVEAERAASEWATMLNNFMVARTLGIGDLTELVNSGFTGVPRELVPRVLEKLKKRSSELRACEGKFLTNKEETGFLKIGRENEVLDPLGFRDIVDAGIDITKEMWDIFFKRDEKGPSALEITKCYEEKTKGMPDYFDSNNCERNKHLEYLGNCGGQDYYYCPCKTSEADIAARFDAQKKI